MNSGPAFILGVHKSGTSLLRNLLDGHHQLDVLPIETHFPLCLGIPTRYPRILPTLEQRTGQDQFAERMGEVLKAYNKSSDRRTDAYLPDAADLQKFNDSIANTPNEAISDKWSSSMHAVLHAYGVETTEERILVEKSVTNLEHGYWLQREMKGARFIVIVRNPYANLVSMRKFFSGGRRFPSLSQPLQILEMGFHFATLYKETLPNTLCIRYEDLVMKPAETMKQVADHLGIEYNEGLLLPSSIGNEWSGNSTSGKALSGVSSDRLQAWRSDITGIEAELINRNAVISRHMKIWAYDEVPADRPMRRAPQEPWRTYLRNRALKWYVDGS